MEDRYKVWTCKIITKNEPHPTGFDAAPRRAAIDAVGKAGFEVISCFSGWGGSLEEEELSLVQQWENR